MTSNATMTWLPRCVLVLAPHTDDGEFGCGGTIAKLVENGCRVIYVAFSAAENSVPVGLPSDVLRTEVKAAVKELGINEKDLFVLNYEVRVFNESRQKILDDMIRMKKEFSPDAVFLPSMSDTHQDHCVVTQEAFRAFKTITMLGYEVPWNNLEFRTSNFFMLEERHLRKKLAALSCYESQKGRGYATENFIRSLTVMRGIQVGGEFAECFEVIRWVVS